MLFSVNSGEILTAQSCEKAVTSGHVCQEGLPAPGNTQFENTDYEIVIIPRDRQEPGKKRPP